MLIAFGAPMLDILVNVEENIITKYNLKPNNTVRFEPHHQNLLNSLEKSPKTHRIGGSITNTLRMFKKLSKDSNNGDVSYFGAIGDDDLGNMITKKLKEENIKPYFQVIKDCDTAKCVVLVNGDNRSLIAKLGASKMFNTSFDRDVLRSGDIFYVSGLFIDTSFESIKIAYKIFMENKKTICLNLGASFVIQKYPKEIKYMFENADVVFGNIDEFQTLADILDIKYENYKDLLKNVTEKLQKINGRTHVLTRGDKSVYIHQNGDFLEFHVPKLNVSQIKDTNGAGDAFVAGFLHKYILKTPLEERVKCALDCSKEIIQKHGFDLD